MKKLLQILLSVILVLSTVLFASACTLTDEDGNIETPITKGYNVRFDTNGGTSVESKKVSVLTNAPTTSKTDYLFDGWFLDSALKNEAKFPLELNYDTTLYAKWVKLADTQNFSPSVIKWWSGNESSVVYYITPSGFELEKLATLDYSMQIEVSYKVHYEKDYNVPLDIGYLGAPKYEIYITNSDGLGISDEDIKTELTKVSQTALYTSKVVDLINQRIKLEFSTDNIQNKIHFTDIVVSYKCVKN